MLDICLELTVALEFQALVEAGENALSMPGNAWPSLSYNDGDCVYSSQACFPFKNERGVEKGTRDSDK
eukprot:m.78001 g.78001  ORF g.78001 m.78001 type:complete len:68 (-) comp8152_c2_seq2:21-224(-)